MQIPVLIWHRWTFIRSCRAQIVFRHLLSKIILLTDVCTCSSKRLFKCFQIDRFTEVWRISTSQWGSWLKSKQFSNPHAAMFTSCMEDKSSAPMLSLQSQSQASSPGCVGRILHLSSAKWLTDGQEPKSERGRTSLNNPLKIVAQGD